MTTRRCVVPDLDDVLTAACTAVEEMLLTIAVWAEDPVEPAVWPAPLAGRVALEALQRVDAVLRPTQHRPDAPGPRLLAPDGRYEHVPLRFVDVDQADLDILAAAARVLGTALLRPYSELAEAVEAGASASGTSGREVVEQLARLHGVLDLEWTADVQRLHSRIATGEDVVLTVDEDAAYARTVDRVNTMLTSGNPLDRWTY